MTTAKRVTYATNALFYTAVPLLRNAVAFLTLPLMTRHLAPADYGVVNMVSMLVALGGFFVLGLNTSCGRYYFLYCDDQDKLRRLYSTNLNFMLISMAAYALILWSAASFLGSKLFANKVVLVWLVAAACQSLFANVNVIAQNFLQNRHQGRHWFRNETGALIVQVVVMVGMVLSGLGTFEAILLSGFLAEGVKSLLSLRYLRPYYGVLFDMRVFMESFRYAWPSIPTSIISYVYGYFDKILVNRAWGLSSVGILDISTRISSVLKVLMDGVDGVVSPVNIGLISTGKASDLQRLSLFNTKIIFLMLTVAFGLICGVREVVAVLTTPAYYFVTFVAPLYVFYHVFGILSFPAFWAIYHRTDLTYIKIVSNLIFLGFSLGLNIILIPRYGVCGAGIAIAVASGVTQVAQLLIGLKITPIPLPLGRISALFLMLIGGTVMAYLLAHARVSYTIDILCKTCALALFVASGFWMGIVTKGNLREFRDIIRMKLRERFTPSCAQEN